MPQSSRKYIVYCLQCTPDENGNETRYVGYSTNIERRVSEHLGIKSGGASWCLKHKPVSVLEVRFCNNQEEAVAMENIMFAIHASQVGYQCCRGSRLNMPGPMKRPPPYMEKCKEHNESPRSDSTQAGSAEETVWEPPKDLPACYEKLRDENGIIEDKPPVQCPCFINPKDPSGQYRQLAALLPA